MSTRISARKAGLMACAVLAGAMPAAAQQNVNSQADDEPAGEIVVTATRQEQRLSRVPISVAAISQQQADKQGVKTVDDVIRLTPGISINRGGNNTNTVAIRGISSQAGAATTGIYIDDVPIQTRNLGYAYGSAYPLIFDLERVEVLRGPQGTLFGAGSEGGTLRFIQPPPNLDRLTVYGRAEVFTIQGGGTGYEAGAAVGVPIVPGKVGLRVSAYYRRDAGWIDSLNGTFVDPNPAGTSAASRMPADFVASGVAEKNSNYANSLSLRAALSLKATDNLTITPAIFYQREKSNDTGQSYYLALSDVSSGQFAIPRFTAGPADVAHTALQGANNQPSLNRFLLPSLTINWEGESLSVTSVTAYFKRDVDQTVDHTLLYSRFLGRTVPQPGDKGLTTLDDRQRNFTQEIRLQSADSAARLTWLVGAFYSHNIQRSIQAEKQNFFVFGNPVFGVPADGPPFGAGTSAFINAFGVPPLADGTSYFGDFTVREKQLAGFGEASFSFADKLKLTAGVRVAKNTLSYTAVYNGPEQNLNAPYGAPCPTGAGTCQPGVGVFVPDFGGGSARSSGSAVTPKATISYQADPRNLFYATVSKGFRPGGAQARLTTGCNGDLIANGFVDGNGDAVSPLTYNADSVWNYEVGSKNRLFGDMLTIDASVYYIKWKDIQTNVALPSCASVVTTNVGKATSQGFDLAVQLRPATGLLIGAAVGHNKTTFDDVNASLGRFVPGSGAPWTVTLTGQYDFAVGNTEAYVRSDYTYASAYRRTGTSVPGTPTYDELIIPRGETSLVNSRIGAKVGLVDLSLFINNLFNSKDSFGIGRDGRSSIVFTGQTFQPRTFGLTASVRY
jgi:outer membrane receptor protein involved in Fe transport